VRVENSSYFLTYKYLWRNNMGAEKTKNILIVGGGMSGITAAV